jgi:hypothetical protein
MTEGVTRPLSKQLLDPDVVLGSVQKEQALSLQEDRIEWSIE